MMKRVFTSLLLVLIAAQLRAQPEVYLCDKQAPADTLRGTWKINLEPAEGFENNEIDFSNWADVQVPGEPSMQGFAIERDKPFVYKKKIRIPEGHENRLSILRFEGVYSQARVWVNGHYMRKHLGGFTPFDMDITPHVEPGSEAIITVEVVDRMDDVSYASGYAKHPIGGILRDVVLFSVPTNHMAYLYYQTDLDENYEDATLSIQAGMRYRGGDDGYCLAIELVSPEGKSVYKKEKAFCFEKTETKESLEIELDKPMLWDSEHPNLYTLNVQVLDEDNETVQSLSRRVGVREVEMIDNELVVNGDIVKLRGAARHEIHPRLGRTSTPEYDLLDVQLAKEANFNHLRTSHYPASRYFMELCDEYGFYVEDETAACWAGTWRDEQFKPMMETHDDTAYAGWYLGQLAELLERDRNHACVVIWSVGNENKYGQNFDRAYEYIKETDPTRPVKFSYPWMIVESGTDYYYDIWSMHYPPAYGGMTKKYVHLGMDSTINNFHNDTMAVIYDEITHVFCYSTGWLKTDPGMRNFWGKSLKRFWDNMYDARGCVGAGIWGYIDEIFFLPDTTLGYGPWGIIDVWRRKKPEFWHARKAYTPTRCLDHYFSYNNNQLIVNVYNRFNHTNFRELDISWESGARSGKVSSPDISPRRLGRIVLQPKSPFTEDVMVYFRKDGRLIDQELFRVERPDITCLPTVQLSEEQMITEKGNLIVARGEGYQATIDKETGKISELTVDGKQMIANGPHIRMNYLTGETTKHGVITVKPWPELTHWEQSGIEVNGNTIISKGDYDSLEVVFKLEFGHNGIRVSYELPNAPASADLTAIVFELDKALDRISWQRDAIWSYMPDDHIGREGGTVSRLGDAPEPAAYREKPGNDWKDDIHDYVLYGPDGKLPGDLPSCNDYRAMKENLDWYSVSGNEQTGIRAIRTQGQLASRIEIKGQKQYWLIADRWRYVGTDINWGNYFGTLQLHPGSTGSFDLLVD